MPDFAGRDRVPATVERYDICLLEFAWVVFTVLVMGPQFEEQCLAIRCDNVAAVAWASRHRAKNPAAHDLSGVLAWATLRYRLYLQPALQGVGGGGDRSPRRGGAAHLRVHLQDDSRRKLCSAGGWTAKTSTAEEYAGLTIEATRHWSHLMVRPVTLL